MALNLSVYRDLKRDYQGGVPFVSQCFLKEMDELYNKVIDILSYSYIPVSTILPWQCDKKIASSLEYTKPKRGR